MAKKPKQRHGRTAATSDHRSADTAALSQAAAHALAQGRYKEAVEAYKELLKRDGKPEWTDCLATAYAGRASDLAAKGMLKEAMALWRTRSELCGSPLLAGPYLGWLVQAGDTTSLLLAYAQHFSKSGTGSADEELTALERMLAPLVLALPDDALTQVPVDAPLISQRPAALAALEAYCRGEESLDAQLAAISYRSPYRDLRQILKAMLLSATAPDTASSLLSKLPRDSAFQRLADALRAAAAPAHRLLNALEPLDSAAHPLVFDLRSIPEGIRPLLEDLANLGSHAGAGALFDLAIRHRRLLPNPAAEALCRSLLPAAGERRQPFQKCFGKLSVVDDTRIQALQAESLGDTRAAARHWLQTVEALKQRGGEGDTLRAALILRHLADLPAYRSSGRAAADEALNWLEESLAFDPDDLETTVLVIRSHRIHDNLKVARRLLDAALKRFSNQPELLLEAMDVALAGNAFKKAVGYAMQVLKADPINPHVRSALGLAYMGHARKKLRSGRPAEVRKELEQADGWLRHGAERGVLKILYGFLAEAEGDGAAAKRQLAEGVTEMGGDLTGQFQVSMEAVRLYRDPLKTLKSFGLKAPKSVAADDLLALVRILERQPLELGVVWPALSPFSSVLRKTAQQAFTEQEHLLICEVFGRLELDAPLLAFTKAARKQHPDSPVFVFHDVTARWGEQPWRMPDRDYEDLENALDDAERAGDMRTAMRIQELLEAAEPPPASKLHLDIHALDDIVIDDAEIREQLRAMVRFLGEKPFLDRVRQSLGNKAFHELELAAGKDALLDVVLDLFIQFGPPPGFELPVPPGAAKPTSGKAPKPRRGAPAPAEKPSSPQGDMFDD